MFVADIKVILQFDFILSKIKCVAKRKMCDKSVIIPLNDCHFLLNSN